MSDEKPEWYLTAISVYKFHSNQLRVNPKWRIADSCKALKKSLGYVSTYLKIAKWLRTHSTEMEKLSSFNDVKEWIGKKELESKGMDINFD